MRVLVSGFGPFGSEKTNPSEQMVNFVNSCAAHTTGVRARAWSALDVRGVVLPVVFDEAFRRLEQERQLFKPDVILSFGLAAGRETIDIEQRAVNVRGGDTGATNQPIVGQTAFSSREPAQRLIDPEGPDELPTTLPTESILAALQSSGVPARVSFSAGTYVCNDLFYQTQRHFQKEQRHIQKSRLTTGVRSGFIHVPRLAATDESESAAAWGWPRFEQAVDAILTALVPNE